MYLGVELQSLEGVQLIRSSHNVNPMHTFHSRKKLCNLEKRPNYGSVILGKYYCTFYIVIVGQMKKEPPPLWIPVQINVQKWHFIPINMGYCLLQFHAMKLFLGVRFHRESLSKLNFFNVNFQIWQPNRKVHRLNRLDTIFHSISDISFRVNICRIHN